MSSSTLRIESGTSSADFVYKPVTGSKCKDRLHALNLGFKELIYTVAALAMGIFVAIGKLFQKFSSQDLSELFTCSKACVKMAAHSFYTAFFPEKGLERSNYREHFEMTYFHGTNSLNWLGEITDS